MIITREEIENVSLISIIQLISGLSPIGESIEYEVNGRNSFYTSSYLMYIFTFREKRNIDW